RRAWLCKETGGPLVGRLAKARSDANAALERWHREAIVRVEHIERRAGIGRIENSTRVELIRPIEGKPLLKRFRGGFLEERAPARAQGDEVDGPAAERRHAKIQRRAGLQAG